MELCSLLKRLTGEYGGLTAIETEGESCTYSELFDRVDTLSRALQLLGCGRGSKLAFISGSAMRFAEFLLALSQLGAELIPLSDERSALPEDTDFVFAGRDMNSAAPKTAPGVCVISEETRPGAETYKKLVRRARSFRAAREVTGADMLLRFPSGARCSSAQLAEYAHSCAQNKASRALLPLPVACLSLARELCAVLACGGTAIMPREFRAKDWIYAIADHSADCAFLTQTMAEAITRDAQYLKVDFSALKTIRCGLTLFEKDTLRKMSELFPKGCIIQKEYGFPRVITRLETTLYGAMRETSDGYTLLGSIGKPENGVKLAAFRGEQMLERGETGAMRCSMDGGKWQELGERGLVSRDGYVFLSRDRVADPAIIVAEGGKPSDDAMSRLLGLSAAASMRELCRSASELVLELLDAKAVGISGRRQEIIPEVTASTIAEQAENASEQIPAPHEYFLRGKGWTEAAPEGAALVCHPLRSQEGRLFGGLFISGGNQSAELVRQFLTRLFEAHEVIYSSQTQCELFRRTAQLSSEGVGISRVEPHPALLFANDIASEQINLAKQEPGYGKMLESVQTENMFALMEPDCSSSSRSFYTRVGERKLWVNYRAERISIDGRDFAVCFSNTQDNRSSTRHLESILTHREIEIVDLLSRGASNKDMAAALGISPNTVKYHLARIYEKMEVSSRTELLTGTFMKDNRKR